MIPSGLHYINNINLNVKCSDFDEFKWQKVPKSNRVVQQYGYSYEYFSNEKPTMIVDMPSIVIDLKNILLEECRKLNINQNFNQCIVNSYEINQGISAHIDSKVFDSVIGCFTIGSGAMMRFKNSNHIYDLFVEENSLYIMSDDARYKYTHEMIKRKTDNVNGKKYKRSRRISITFRNVKQN